MADKLNIPLPDGSGTLEIPAWATETTLSQMVQLANREQAITRQMLKGVKKGANVDDEVLDALNDVIKGVKSNTETDKEDAKGKSAMIIAGAKHISKAAGFFGNAEKPLSGVVDSASQLVNTMKGSDGKGGLAAVTKKFPAMRGFLDRFGGGLDLATDAVLAYAGWNAKKFEQFAEVQGKMIESGAIFFDSASSFDDLYSSTFKAGVTYNAFAETVQGFGGTMTALGGDVSRGSQNFVKLFKSMSEGTDDLGDLGMKNTELMTSYANYMETQRLTGGIDKKLADGGAGLEKGFTDLVIESTALASLTSLNRGDALARQMDALSDTFGAAGVSRLKDQGLDGQAATAEAFMKQLSLVKDQGPGNALMEELASSLNRNLFQFSDNIKDFDIRTGMNGEAKAAFETAMEEGFFERINKMVQDGDITSEEANNALLKEFNNMDMTKIATAAAGGGTFARAVQDLQGTGIMIQKNFGEWIKLGAGDIEAKLAETTTKLAEAGTTIKTINDATKMFLSMQDAITLPFTTLTSITSGVAETFNNIASAGADKKSALTQWFNSTSDNDDETPVVTTANTGPPGTGDTIPLPTNTSLTDRLTSKFDSTPAAQLSVANLPALKERLTKVQNGSIIRSNNTFEQREIQRLETEYLTRSIAALEADAKLLENKRMEALANRRRGHHY